MPHLDGIEATRRIKQEHPQMVIIGLSVQSAAQVADSMLQAGASRYLTKESAADQLYETIIAAAACRSSSATDVTTGKPSPGGN
jgi:DNA-binding NarL/FixJ family response regulator